MDVELTEADIEQWVGGTSLQRGRSYFRSGAIVQPRRQGQTLKALCEGSAPTPYRVEVKLGSEGIQSDLCSCPIGGHCKHAAALLLTWLHKPDSFMEVEALEKSLERRTKEELIALIGKMVARHPDLEGLLELPMPGGKGGKPLDAEKIRRQVLSAFRYAGDDWDAARSASMCLALPLAITGSRGMKQ